ncbi:hypothetical protein [Gallaecimonas pentaromativorans]|uniref:hypothetical protein n=1 Tax=Gallaecimonas pentaromativorans TaxID=584787 RepID=UPI003A94243F
MEREELHRRIELLQNKLKNGEIKFAPHLIDGFWESMKQVKILPDGMVDPETVDGRVRSLCMFIAYENDRQEWKDAVPLRDIQEGYFQRVNYAFGQLFEMMTEAKADPYKFAGWFSSDEGRVKDCLPVIDEFYNEIMQFWENISEPTWMHLEDSFDSKAVFTGELFPDGRSNVASSTGLYFDTTILPDPFLKISPMLQFMSDEEKCYDVVRLALQVLSYKSLALADIEKPIVAVLPDRHQLEEGYREFVTDCAVSDSIEHTKTLFGQEIQDKDELFAYYSHFKDADEVVRGLIKPDKLVFATEWDGSLAQQMMRLLEEQGEKLGMKTAGQAVFMHLISRFSQANDAFQRSLQLRGTPIIRAETSWIWYNQMLEYNAGNSELDKLNDLHIARALNSTVKNEIPWMGNIPPDALIEIRKSGALDEIRNLLSAGLKSVIEANPSNFYRTGDKVFDNLDSAFKEHEMKIKELISKKWTFAGKDIGSFVVVGGVEITAAITGLPMFGALGAIAGMTGVIPTVRDLKEKYKQLKAEESEINSTGVGILLKNKRQK